MSKVFVVDTHKTPLDPVHPGQARRLLTQGKAAVLRHQPFTIILKNAVPAAQTTPLRLKIDPGAKTTGLAVVNDATGEVVWAADLQHRGFAIKKSMDMRRSQRRRRRTANLRHRAPRWRNRKPKYAGEDRLPPSLQSRLSNTMTWVGRLRRWCPIAALSMELVRFDTQLMQNPDISGMGYQQGELAGYEVREYLLEKGQRICAYCKKTGVPLQVEHIVPCSRGGSDRVSNLCIACGPCNDKKGTRTAAEFGYPDVQAKARVPLRDAAALNVTRWVLFRRLQTTGLPLEIGTGGRTKFNRSTRNLPKTHWLDAACVGASTPERLDTAHVRPVSITAKGWGTRQMCQTDKYGFPIRYRTRAKTVLGFATGDVARAVVLDGKEAGHHLGRLTIRQSKAFKIDGRRVHARFCILLQKADGYAYTSLTHKDGTAQ